MKKLIALAFLTCCCHQAVGQGFISSFGTAPDPSIQFNAALLPIPSAQSASSGGGAYFFLDRDVFNGGGGFNSSTPSLFANIVDRRGNIVYESVVSSRIEGSPFSATLIHWPHTILTES